MSITQVVSVVLVLMGGLRGAAASDLQVFEKSLHRGKSLLFNANGRHNVRNQPHQQIQGEIRRSLGVEHLNVHVTPTATRYNRPTIIKLYPPTAQPLHQHANMPLRFGRDGEIAEEGESNLARNLPQRFGRSWGVLRECPRCPHVRETSNPVLPQRFGRDSPDWSLLRALASEQLFNTNLHWSEDLDFTSSSEENMEMQEKPFGE